MPTCSPANNLRILSDSLPDSITVSAPETAPRPSLPVPVLTMTSNAESPAGAVRSHGPIEDELHWALAVTFREDESRIRRSHGAEVISTLRRLTLSLPKKNTSSNASLKHKCKIDAMDEKLLTELIQGI